MCTGMDHHPRGTGDSRTTGIGLMHCTDGMDSPWTDAFSLKTLILDRVKYLGLLSARTGMKCRFGNPRWTVADLSNVIMATRS